MMSPDSVPSAMPLNRECVEEEEEELWNGDSENKECDEIHSIEDGNEATEICEDRIEEPKEGMTFDTSEDAHLYYFNYAKQKGFDVATRTSRKGKDGKLKNVILSCSRAGKARVTTSNPVKPRPQSKIDCPAHITVVLYPNGKWRFNRVYLEHNHEQSPTKARFFRCNRVLNEDVKKRLDVNDRAGIKLCKTFDSLQVEAGGPGELPYLQKDCRNYLDKQRRLRLVEGDAEAMHSYFMRMRADNSDFFFDMDLNEKGRLRNVFWADARSRAACKEFGDVVTFDTTYLLNRHEMPFAPFVGVNHHGQSILLGCGLISHEDTETFSWLFNTWKTCMEGCAPKAIITDQCMAMKNAVENVFPDTRHRWCIWHIMKKIPEKLNGYNDYEKISWCMRKAVYDSLTIEQFEEAWGGFIKKYELESNEWLKGLYLERERWVPAYLKDVFWAGMSSTQRSESMNAYFDGYVHAKTTLKQFVEQYENALANKVESEHLEDVKSWSTYIPLLTGSELEEQFYSVYTNKKVEEFRKEFVGKLECACEKKGEGQYEVAEQVTFGEGEEKTRRWVPFTVIFNAETNEAHCNCRLFESRGMVCKHQLMVWHQMRVGRVPDKYVLRRWCKNVKRVHTRIRIGYDKSETPIETQRHDSMCNLFNEVVALAEDSKEKYDMVMTRVRELKEELQEASVVCESNAVPDSLHAPFSLGSGGLSSKQSILDPEGIRRKGRPQCKRKQGIVEKAVKKKKETKKKTLSKEKAKEVDRIAVGHGFGTQESVANINVHPCYMGQSMWPNMMPFHMPPNMAQGGSVFPFSPNLCPTGTSFNQFMPSFPSAGSQVWGGGQTSLLEAQVQYLGGPQTQRQGCGGQQSFMAMMNENDHSEQ